MEYTKPEYTLEYNTLQSYAIACNPLNFTDEEKSNWLYNFYKSKQGGRNAFHILEVISNECIVTRVKTCVSIPNPSIW